MTGNTAAQFFLVLALALIAAKLFGAIARRCGQPAVVGEILAGVLASPMILSDHFSALIMPATVKPLLSALANVGLATFMFIIGYELDNSLLNGRRRATASLAAGSVIVPLIGGILLAMPLAARYSAGSSVLFILFTGLAMSVTAFPVLARILSATGLNRTQLGGLALSTAAVGDLVAWAGLAGLAFASGAQGAWQIAMVPAYLAVMALVVRPLAGRLLRAAQDGTLSAGLLPLLGIGLMLSCACTEWLGVHFIFGAFIFGAVLPKAGLASIRASVINQMDNAGALLLPLYFIVAGTRVSISGFGAASAIALLLVLGTAITTKLVGAYAGGHFAGLSRSDSLVIAVLLNTRGLTEIVIAGVGLDIHVITEDFYSMIVIMAIVTTAATGPLLALVRRYFPQSAAGSQGVIGDREFVRTE